MRPEECPPQWVQGHFLPPCCNTLSVVPELDPRNILSHPRPPMGSSFESWIYRSVGTDPGPPPCQSPVSAYRWFSQIAASLSVWSGLLRSREQTVYWRWMIGKDFLSIFYAATDPVGVYPCESPWLTFFYLLVPLPPSGKEPPVTERLPCSNHRTSQTYLKMPLVMRPWPLHSYVWWHSIVRDHKDGGWSFLYGSIYLQRVGIQVHRQNIWRQHSHHWTCHGMLGCCQRDTGPKEEDECQLWGRNSLSVEVRRVWILNLLHHSHVIFKKLLNVPKLLFPHLKNEVNDIWRGLK